MVPLEKLLNTEKLIHRLIVKFKKKEATHGITLIRELFHHLPELQPMTKYKCEISMFNMCPRLVNIDMSFLLQQRF